MSEWHYGPRSPREGGGYIPAATRQMVFDRDGDDCFYCGQPDADTLDHVYPHVQGGSSEPTNLVVACRTCNSIAGMRVFPELRNRRIYVLERREELGIARIAMMDSLARAIREIEAVPTGIDESTRALATGDLPITTTLQGLLNAMAET